MLNLHRQANPRGQVLKILLHEPGPGTIAAAAITPEDEFGGPEILPAEFLLPPIRNAVTGEFRGVFACAQRHIAGIPGFVVQAMGHHHASGVTGKTMIVDRVGSPLFHIHLTGAIDQANILFFSCQY